MLERDALDSIFRYLQEEDFRNILIKLGNQKWNLCWTEEGIVLLNLGSEHTRNVDVK